MIYIYIYLFVFFNNFYNRALHNAMIFPFLLSVTVNQLMQLIQLMNDMSDAIVIIFST